MDRERELDTEPLMQEFEQIIKSQPRLKQETVNQLRSEFGKLLATKSEKAQKHINNLRLYTNAELSLSEEALDHEVRMSVLEGIKLDLQP